MNAYKRAADDAYAAWSCTHRQIMRLRNEARSRELTRAERRELARLEAMEFVQFRYASRLWRAYQLHQAACALAGRASRALARNLDGPSRIKDVARRCFFLRKEVTMKQIKSWDGIVSALLGVWLMVSPWVLKFTESLVARDNAVLTGLAVFLAGLWVLSRENGWQFQEHKKATG